MSVKGAMEEASREKGITGVQGAWLVVSMCGSRQTINSRFRSAQLSPHIELKHSYFYLKTLKSPTYSPAHRKEHDPGSTAPTCLHAAFVSRFSG